MGNDVAMAPGPEMQAATKVVPLPAHISELARATLSSRLTLGNGHPPVDDKDGWREFIATANATLSAKWGAAEPRLHADAQGTTMGGVPVQIGTPQGDRLVDDSHVILAIHGGGLLLGGGEGNVRYHAKETAVRTGCRAYAPDYRVAPDHPYPAALDDCLAVYRALLEQKSPEQIVVSGVSAGGNLAAALLLRARDEGLPTPGGAILRTPEVDLTESGDTFETLLQHDSILSGRLMPMNLVYADGADLAHPYLSPLFGDLAGFPPTWLQSGGRDGYLSNTIRMHRKLRSAGVRAELHVWEAMPHGGFGGVSPEDREMDAEMKCFIATLP